MPATVLVMPVAKSDNVIAGLVSTL